MYNKKKVFKTLKGLILTGSDKVTPESVKPPTLMVGFKDDRPKMSVYFNTADTKDLMGAELRKHSVHLIIDYNALIIGLGFFHGILEKGDDDFTLMNVQDTKFDDEGRPTKDLENKGVVKMGILNGHPFVEISNAVGVTATFKFRKPYRAKFYNPNGSSQDKDISMFYALGWCEDFRAVAAMTMNENSVE